MTNPVQRSSKKKASGFTLVELMVAMAIFMVIGSAALMLLRRHAPMFTAQQNEAGLNLAMRNTAAQMQIDGVNAGTGFYTGSNLSSWPVGVTITNQNPGTDCHNASTFVYGSTCFDSVNLIAVDPAAPPANPSNLSTGTGCALTDATTAYLIPPASITAANLAALYKTNDEVLFVNQDGSQYTAAKLTANATVVSGRVMLTHTATNSSGLNTTASNDPLGISTVTNTHLGRQYCNSGANVDYVLRLQPIKYCVDATSDTTNPRLVRITGTAACLVTNGSIMAEQIIGFKVGAMLINGTVDAANYNYNPTTYPTANDFSTVRAIRVTMIGRTKPNNDPANNYRNTFDGGPYKIRAMSVVVNPRNMSMNDQ